MKYNFKQKSNRFTLSPINNKAGFTLIETMVAAFILTLALTGLLTLNANTLFTARYARNQITANYLIQEAADSIRNDRDTTAFLHNGGGTWNSFLNKYGFTGVPSCFVPAFSGNTSSVGCSMEFSSVAPTPISCNVAPAWGTLHCPIFNYTASATNNSFYTYTTPSGQYVPSDFKRQILMMINPSNPNELDIKITVEWLNGGLVHSQSLQTSLLKWQ
jgi:prepilin-type N-terminal cleavage/methylation domain-containing protein